MRSLQLLALIWLASWIGEKHWERISGALRHRPEPTETEAERAARLERLERGGG